MGDVDLAENVVKLNQVLEERGLTTAEVARLTANRSDVTSLAQAHISRIRNGHMRLGAEYAVSLALVLELPTLYFYEPRPPKCLTK